MIGGSIGKGLSSEEPECAQEKSRSHKRKQEDSASEEHEFYQKIVVPETFRLSFITR